MPRHYSRVNRVGDLIQTTLATILQEEFNTPALGMITVTSVEVSPDFSFAKVFVSVLDETQAKVVIKELNAETKHFRHELAQKINLRRTPNLKFFYDDSSVRGTHISSLIHNALKDKE